MGFRFRKSIRIMPGMRINLSRSGVSTSIGGRGATLNIGRKGARATVGIPGTGLSYSTRLGAPPATGRSQPSTAASVPHAGPAPPAPSPRRAAAGVGAWVLAGIGLLAIGTCALIESPTPPQPSRPAVAARADAIPDTPVRTAAVDQLRCRAAPNGGSKVLGHLSRGSPLSVVEAAGDWTQVRSGTDRPCWVATRLLG